MGRLNLPDGSRTQIFRAIVAQLRADATLSGTDLKILAWEDDPEDNKQLDDFQFPALRLTPNIGAMAWLYENAQAGYLVVDVDASIPGMNADDFMNLQDAIEEALYPADNNAFINSLIPLGATTGLIEFAKPFGDSMAGRDEKFRPMGTFQIEVRRDLL